MTKLSTSVYPERRKGVLTGWWYCEVLHNGKRCRPRYKTKEEAESCRAYYLAHRKLPHDAPDTSVPVTSVYPERHKWALTGWWYCEVVYNDSRNRPRYRYRPRYRTQAQAEAARTYFLAHGKFPDSDARPDDAHGANNGRC
jgi:hypothetical protein